MAYEILKLVHVLAVIVWVGGVLTIGILSARLARAQDRTAIAALGRQNAAYGRSVLGPAAATTLIAGIAATAVGDIPFTSLWIAWGFIAVLASMAIGAGLMQPAGAELGKLMAAGEPPGERAAQLQRRMARLGALNMIILISAVAAMVLKPTL